MDTLHWACGRCWACLCGSCWVGGRCCATYSVTCCTSVPVIFAILLVERQSRAQVDGWALRINSFFMQTQLANVCAVRSQHIAFFRKGFFDGMGLCCGPHTITIRSAFCAPNDCVNPTVNSMCATLFSLQQLMCNNAGSSATDAAQADPC